MKKTQNTQSSYCLHRTLLGSPAVFWSAHMSGSEALEVHERNKSKINLVILDMIMPEMGGGETFDHLKEIDPEINVIIASGYSLNGEASGIIARGCKGFIQKPVRIAELSQRVSNMLGKKVKDINQ